MGVLSWLPHASVLTNWASAALTSGPVQVQPFG